MRSPHTIYRWQGRKCPHICIVHKKALNYLPNLTTIIRVFPLQKRMLVAVALLGTATAGVYAYLSMTSSPAEQDFPLAEYPVVTVNGTSVTVAPKGYAVYLRVAVDANWQKDGVIYLEEPVGAYTCNDGWIQLDDTFLYYRSVIQLEDANGSITLTPIIVNDVTKEDYTLEVNMAAQVVQAVGMTDDGTKTAVEAAWGVTPQQITGN